MQEKVLITKSYIEDISKGFAKSYAIYEYSNGEWIRETLDLSKMAQIANRKYNDIYWYAVSRADGDTSKIIEEITDASIAMDNPDKIYLTIKNIPTNITEVNENMIGQVIGQESNEFLNIDLTKWPNFVGGDGFGNVRVRLNTDGTSTSKGFAKLYRFNTQYLNNDESNPNIGAYKFYDCISLELTSGFAIPPTKFGNYCFNNCYNLKLENEAFAYVETIGRNAFYRAYSLNNLTFPSSLKSIGDYAFGGCKFNRITFTNVSTLLPTIASNAFASCTNLKNIYVPWDIGEVANAPWGASNATIHYNHYEG